MNATYVHGAYGTGSFALMCAKNVKQVKKVKKHSVSWLHVYCEHTTALTSKYYTKALTFQNF